VLGYQATRTQDAALRARVERLTRTLGPAVLSGNPAPESPR
jgi:hypothetical protein